MVLSGKPENLVISGVWILVPTNQTRRELVPIYDFRQ